MRRKASAAPGAAPTWAGSAAGPTIANRLATNGQASSTWPGATSSRCSRLGACVITTSRSPRAAAARICPDGPTTVVGAGRARESSSASAPDCSTVYVVPSRSGASPRLVHAPSAPHISPAHSLRSVAMRRLVPLFALVVPAVVSAQGFPLTVESIMRGPDVVGTAPSNVRFSADGRYVYFTWRSPGVDTLDRDYRVSVAGASQAPERLPRVAEERMRADTDTVHTVKPLYLGERQGATQLAVAPDARFVLVTVTERAKGDSVEGRQVVMPTWVTQSGYVETQQIRTKVGDAQPRERAALIDVATGRVTWIDSVGTGERNAAGVAVSPNSRHALIRVTTTSYHDAWLVGVDLPSLATRVVLHRHDDAWLGEVGFLGAGSYVGWLADGETIYYGSEETGYAQ